MCRRRRGPSPFSPSWWSADRQDQWDGQHLAARVTEKDNYCSWSQYRIKTSKNVVLAADLVLTWDDADFFLLHCCCWARLPFFNWGQSVECVYCTEPKATCRQCKNQPNAYNMYTDLEGILSACLYLHVSLSSGVVYFCRYAFPWVIKLFKFFKIEISKT